MRQLFRRPLRGEAAFGMIAWVVVLSGLSFFLAGYMQIVLGATSSFRTTTQVSESMAGVTYYLGRDVASSTSVTISGSTLTLTWTGESGEAVKAQYTLQSKAVTRALTDGSVVTSRPIAWGVTSLSFSQPASGEVQVSAEFGSSKSYSETFSERA